MSIRAELQRMNWLSPWAALTPERAGEFERELTRILRPQHELAQTGPRGAKAIAAHSDTPDVLFWLHEPDQLCVVHLGKTPHEDPAWPFFIVFDTAQAFVDGCMQPDHLEACDEDV
jgi:hypothetical protein